MQGPRNAILNLTSWALRRPGVAFPLWFLLLIALATPLLMLKVSTRAGVEPLRLLDALFTAVSAACTTGLTVAPAESLSPFAYAVIGTIIQLGGLGLVFFTAALMHKLHHRITAPAPSWPPVDTANAAVPGDASLIDDSARRFLSQARFAVVAILLIEFIGALLLMPMWEPVGRMESPGGLTLHDGGGAALSLGERFGISLFHAVSAFCNAGFCMWNDSFEAYRYRLPLHTIVAGLIVLGGLGLPVLRNLLDITRASWRRRRETNPPHVHGTGAARLSLHSRIVLTTTASLYLAGVASVATAQIAAALAPPGNESLAGSVIDQPPFGFSDAGRALADASFLAITSRTGGFSAAPMDELAPPSRVAVMAMMLIGASPGGAGGGVKTTTFAVIALAIVCTLRRHPSSLPLGRRIGDTLLRQALVLAGVLLTVVATAVLMLSFTEPFPFERLLFESISAASNTGLSLGVTPHLSAPGKVIIMATMYFGSLAPMAAMDAMIPGPFAFTEAPPHERVAIA